MSKHDAHGRQGHEWGLPKDHYTVNEQQALLAKTEVPAWNAQFDAQFHVLMVGRQFKTCVYVCT